MKKEKEMVLNIVEILKSNCNREYGTNIPSCNKNSEQEVYDKIFTDKVKKEIKESFKRNLKYFPQHDY